MAAPQFTFIYQAGGNYRGFNIYETDAEYYYLSRVREVYDGHWRIANPLLAEGKSLPYVQGPLPEIIMGLTGKLLHISVGPLVTVFRVLSPALLFLLFYALTNALTGGKRLAALIAPTIILLASNLVSYPGQLWDMIRGNFQATQFLIYARPVNPQISSLFHLAWLYCFWRLLQTSRWRFSVACGLLFGLSFYVYPYTWSFILVFSCLSLVVLWRQKRRLNIKQLSAGLIGGLIIAIPNFINTYRLLNHPDYETLQIAYGIYQSHTFVWSQVIFFGLIGVRILYYLRSHKLKDFYWYSTLLFISGFILINQQVITGRILYYGHYHWYFNRPFFVLMTAILIAELCRRLPKNWPKITGIALIATTLILSFFNSYWVQSTSYAKFYPDYVKVQKYRGVIDWLNSNVKTDEIAYVPGSYYYPYPDRPSRLLSKFIITYTPLNLYYYSEAHFYLSPYKDFGEYNLFITLKLLGIKPELAYQTLEAEPTFFRDIYMDYFKVRDLSYDHLPDEDIKAAADRYRAFYGHSWREIFSKYPLDYVVWDSRQAPQFHFDRINAQEHIFDEVYNAEDIVVYRFRP